MHSTETQNEGDDLLASGQYRKALEFFEIALRKDPQNIYFHYAKGEALYWLEYYQDALICYEIVLTFNSEHVDGLRGKGNVLRILDKNSESLGSLDFALKINPQDNEALFGKGRTLENLNRKQEAHQYFEKAFKGFKIALEVNNDLRVLFRLMLCYLEGLGIEMDRNQASKYCQMAVERGHLKAQFYLGWIPRVGQIFTQDDKLGVEWYTKTAKQGSAAAQYELGTLYENGQGVKRDCSVALMWYKKAANKQYIEAQNSCNRILLKIIKNKIRDGKLFYEEIEQEEFDALVILLQENYPITSLKFSYTEKNTPYSYGPDKEPGYRGYYGYYGYEGQFSCVNKVNALSINNLTKLMNMLLNNKTITNLSLAFHSVDIQFIAKLLESNRILVNLELSEMHLNQKDVEVISEVLTINQSLLKLELIKDTINDEGVLKLSNMLLCNKIISEVNLQGNAGISIVSLQLVKNRLKENNAARWFFLLSNYPNVFDKNTAENVTHWSIYNQWKEKELKPYKGCKSEKIGKLLDRIVKLPRDLRILVVSFIEEVTPSLECIDKTRLVYEKWLRSQSEEVSVLPLSHQIQQPSTLVFSDKALNVVNLKQPTILEEPSDSSKAIKDNMQMKSN